MNEELAAQLVGNLTRIAIALEVIAGNRTTAKKEDRPLFCRHCRRPSERNKTLCYPCEKKGLK